MTSTLMSPGNVIGGDFVVVRPLNEGGMGAVFVVEQKSTGKTRALKVMHREIVADAGQKKRFEREARIGAKIASEHVVEVVAAGVDADTRLPFLVMELLEGEDLRSRLARGDAIPVEELRTIFEQLCHAMAAAHEAGIVHRDLKPENVFLARSRRASGGAFTVKVLDFGIAKLVAESSTHATRGAVGSPMWMAPEQTAPGPVTAAADVWALGLLAYELFTGRSFWRSANASDGTTAQLLREIVIDPIPLATERAREQGVAARLPAGFDAWFARCVVREPLARFADAGHAWRAMKRLFDPTDALAETVATKDPEQIVTSPPPAAPPPPAPVNPLPPETPVATVRSAEPPPLRAEGGQKSNAAMFIGGGIAIAGIAVAIAIVVAMTRAQPDVVVVTPPAAETKAPPPPPASAAAAAPPPEAPSAPAAPSAAVVSATAPVPVASSAAPRAPKPSATPKPAPAPLAGRGFGDPQGRPSTWTVQDRKIRLFTRLVSNDSNVADAVVKEAIEWNPWHYLLCYERNFKGAKELPEGVVVVSFEILDQLPRYAKLVSSTIASPSFNDCVVRTVVGQTVNAAGPDGKGPASMAFKFVPM